MKHKKIIKSMNEFIEKDNDMNMILEEMARINDPKEFPYDVFVYGGNSFGSGRNEHGEPHYSFSKKGEFSLKIKIPTLLEWNQNKRIEIIEGDQSNCNGKIFRNLVDWLDFPNKKNQRLSNIEVIILFWNTLNADNKNVRKV